MNSAPPKRSSSKGTLVKERGAARPILRDDEVVLQYLHRALRQADILFWFSFAAGAAATALQLCMIVCAMTQSHTEFQMGTKLMLSLSFNTVAVVAYRQAREFRQRATAVLIKARRLNLAVSIISGGDLPPLSGEWLGLLQSLVGPEAENHASPRDADKSGDKSADK